MTATFKVLPLPQRSEEWREWRTKVIGASEAAAILKENPWKTREDVMLEKLGIKEKFTGNDATKRGERLEPIARKLYESIVGETMADAVVVSCARPWQAASLDGINKSYTKAVEIKCGLNSHRHTLKTGTPPDYYYAQLQHILSVTGLAEIDYFSYSPEAGPHTLIKISRNEAYISKLLELELQFWNELCARRSEEKTQTTKEFRKIIFDGGGIYEGEIQNGKLHGNGKYTWPNGDTYEGHWVDQTRSGWGRITWASGGSYCGNFKNDKFDGFGSRTRPDGSKHSGQWSDGELQGIVKIENSSGVIYEGSYSRGMMNGIGKLTLGPEEYFIGTYLDDQLSGFGVMVADDSVFEGEWEDGFRHGYGRLRKTKGEFYEGQWFTGELDTGEWVDDKFHGYGRFTNLSGHKHYGQFYLGHPKGFGTRYSEEGIWEGEFGSDAEPKLARNTTHNGEEYYGNWNPLTFEREGDGRCVYSDGTVYQGSWTGGVRSGHGCLLWPNGDEYRGQWTNDKKNGTGILSRADGSSFRGTWVNDFRLREGEITDAEGHHYIGESKLDIPHGRGTKIWTDGREYSGEWRNGLPHGEGKQTWPDGQEYFGNWKDGLQHGEGKQTWPDGRNYFGNWRDGFAHGLGKLTYTDGKKYIRDLHALQWTKIINSPLVSDRTQKNTDTESPESNLETIRNRKQNSLYYLRGQSWAASLSEQEKKYFLNWSEITNESTLPDSLIESCIDNASYKRMTRIMSAFGRASIDSRSSILFIKGVIEFINASQQKSDKTS